MILNKFYDYDWMNVFQINFDQINLEAGIEYTKH